MSTHEIAALGTAFETPFRELGHSAERDRATVLATWPTVPVEVIRAAGFAPVFARGATTPTPAADAVLEAGVFPARIHQLFEAALGGRLANVAAIVLPRTSDPDYKAYLYLKQLERQGMRLPPVLLFDLLQSATPETRDYNAERLRNLFAQLARLAGRAMLPDSLREQVARGNAARLALRRILALRTGRPRLAGSEAVPLQGAFWQLQPERYCMLAERAAETIAARQPMGGPRILLTGVPIDSTVMHAAIESCGATVVCELSPFGADAAAEDVDPAADVFHALADWYGRNLTSARLTGAALARRVQAVLPDVDAAVALLAPDDARFGWEHPRLRALFAARGIPYMTLVAGPGATLDEHQRPGLRNLLDSIGQRPTVRHG